MNIGRIPYVNASPFFHAFPVERVSFLDGYPRALADAARAGRIAAGLLPVVEAWALEDRFLPLGDIGIAVEGQTESVFLLSRCPPAELEGPIGVTAQSASSVALCRVLLGERYRRAPVLRRGFHDDDAARLVIGDDALMAGLAMRGDRWRHTIDLAEEWRLWQGLPFVFARWVVSRDLPSAARDQLLREVSAALDSGLADLDAVARAQALRTGLMETDIRRYLARFRYHLGAREHEGETAFRQLCQQVKSGVAAT